MFKLWKKQPATEPAASSSSSTIPWSPEAKQALEQAVSQAPVPAMMRGMVKKELEKAGEEHAQKSGHATVTPEDLMQGLMAKLPADMKAKVEDAMKKGPEGLQDLQKDLK